VVIRDIYFGGINDTPATRLWFPSGESPKDSDFAGNSMACEFGCLWDAVEDVGNVIIKGNRPNGLDPWIKWGAVLLDENKILIRYRNSIGRPDAPRP
jgi:hypothetical protein